MQVFQQVPKGRIPFYLKILLKLNLALLYWLPSSKILKICNWIGPLLVAAAESGVNQLLLFGYHGKLIKLAGGVFHTHHHLADNRLDTLISLAVKEGIPIASIREFQNEYQPKRPTSQLRINYVA